MRGAEAEKITTKSQCAEDCMKYFPTLERSKVYCDTFTASGHKCTWKIQNFSTLTTNSLRSDTFIAGGHKWRLLIFPKGDRSRNVFNHLSLYLSMADNTARLPDAWTIRAKLSLSIVNQVDRFKTVKKETKCTFSASTTNQGFSTFMPLGELCVADGGFIMEDSCIVRAQVLRVEQEKDQQVNTEEMTDLRVDPSLAEQETNYVGEYDAMLSEIQNFLRRKASDVAGALTGFMPFQVTEEDIGRAKRTVKDCAKMKIETIFQSGGASEIKKSLSIMLIAGAFHNKPVHKIANFLSEFDLYLTAQRDLQEAKVNESLFNELKSRIKRYSLEHVSIKNSVNEIDREAAELERKLTERNVKKAKLMGSLEDLSAQVTGSRQAIIKAEKGMKLLCEKKERTKELSGNIESLWESFNKD